MQMPVSQAPSGLFGPCQQAYGSSNSQPMQQFPSGQPPCGLYLSGLQFVQPQQQCGLVHQQQQALSAGTGSAGARNPFAAMPRELRNSQLRSNLAAVAGAFSACSGSAASGRGASPPAGGPRGSMVPPPPPPQHKQQEWAAPAMQGAAVTPNSMASTPGMYLAASSGMDVAPTQLPVSMGMAGCSYASVPGLQQAYASVGNSNSSLSGPYSTGMSGAYTAPLPQPLHSTYLQQQQRMMMSQQADMRGGFYSDPLPYLGGVTMAAPAMPASQQQQQAQAQQLLFGSQGMPCNLQPMEAAGMPYAAAAAGGEVLSHAQLLLQKQQALQQLQAEQMMLLRLLPDA